MYKFNDCFLKDLPTPESGNKITYDPSTPGLGLRVTAAGAKAFVLNYRVAGRERRLTIGAYGPNHWTLVRARKRAGELRRQIDNGVDPLAKREEDRNALTVAQLLARVDEQHFGKLRPSTVSEYRSLIKTYVEPELGSVKVANLTARNVDDLHHKISKRATYRANRTIALLHRALKLAVRWKLRADNPASGVEKNAEEKRQRFLDTKELLRLTKALDAHHDKQAADIIRLLLLTGARRGEVQGAKWSQLDLERGVWVKPASLTKQRKEHRVPLSDAAVALLEALREDADADALHVFPSHGKTGYRVEIEPDWKELSEVANLKGVRLHDLRHTYASILASDGLSLPVIGALLGHSQPSTTQRYSHLLDSPLRKATQHVANVVTNRPSAEIIELSKRA